MAGTFGSINTPLGVGDAILTNCPIMGQGGKQANNMGLVKTFSRTKKKGVCIQQSQNKSTLLKTVYCKFRGRAEERNQSSSAFNENTSCMKAPHASRKINATKAGYLLESTEHQE